MKIVNLKKLKRILAKAGYQKIRGGDHDIWSNGTIKVAIPRSKLYPAISHKIITQCGLKI